VDRINLFIVLIVEGHFPFLFFKQDLAANRGIFCSDWFGFDDVIICIKRVSI